MPSAINLDPAARKIAVIGLGYVGLPLAVEFARYRNVLGFDIEKRRIAELKAGEDRTRELTGNLLRDVADHLGFSDDSSDLADCDTFIVTVPTPIDKANRPDFGAIESASRTVGKAMKAGALVVYESTVYPGATEEVAVPILEEVSGLRFNEDFFVGYSPERINPGDPDNRLPDIKKITSGSTPEVADLVDALYLQIITAGTHKASSIRVAEAAKVIENTQRDINIALINELAMLFDRMGLDTGEVLEAAGTKWNFLPFRPGLVGGHCIGVDPYYLTHKAEMVGHHAELILAGRRINDNMAVWAARKLANSMSEMPGGQGDGRILVRGITFKENCPDIRNSKVADLVAELGRLGFSVDVCDPLADALEVRQQYGLTLHASPPRDDYDAVVVAVGHDRFREVGASASRALCREGALLFDLKSLYGLNEADLRL
jgi:UDP-N-acetyl-D-glucosamine/UDP-N-acetyl-D-galactosamine dehydrogenase